jgi:hypothetical protein
MRRLAALFVGGGLVMLAGCSNHLTSRVQIDGAQFSPTGCNNGIVYGFAGVQFQDAAGRRLRVLNNPATNEVRVAWFPDGTGRGYELGTCASLRQRRGTGTINGVQNQEGAVSFSCDSEGHKISGSIDFKNCH